MGKLLNFKGFIRLFEGGNAIKGSVGIKESQFIKTLDSIKSNLFPIIGIDPDGINDEWVIIGSIGKKENPEDKSGDLDIGYDLGRFIDSSGVTGKRSSEVINDIISSNNNLTGIFGIPLPVKWIKEFNIFSIGWPIEGDPSKGLVQVDLIPISDMDWAEFIYYSPDFKKKESKYKSAHRNWLFSAILTSRGNVLESDDDGNLLVYETPVLILSDGLFWHTKSYKGKMVSRLSRPKKIEGSEKFITNDPQEFVDFLLGDGYKPSDVRTFEDVFNIIMSPNFNLKDSLEDIKRRYINFLDRAGLEIPTELNRIK
jgi:hypothetical protein